MRTGSAKSVRCAVYTRVSTDQGLEQDFNSLDAQARWSGAGCDPRPYLRVTDFRCWEPRGELAERAQKEKAPLHGGFLIARLTGLDIVGCLGFLSRVFHPSNLKPQANGGAGHPLR
jgi:hypothetical protein